MCLQREAEIADITHQRARSKHSAQIARLHLAARTKDARDAVGNPPTVLVQERHRAALATESGQIRFDWRYFRSCFGPVLPARHATLTVTLALGPSRHDVCCGG